MTGSNRRNMLKAASVVALIALAITLAARADAVSYGSSPSSHKHGAPDTTVTIDVHPLKPGVYAAKINFTWTGWVELDDGILVVDAGFNELSARALADTIRARSGKRPFRYLVNTHHHQDHTGGDRYFAALGATVVAHEKVAEPIQHMLSWAPGEVGDTLSHLGITPKVKRIARRISFGGPKRLVQVLSLGKPAHTAGDLIVYLPRQRVLFAGDVVSNRSVPWLLDPGMKVDGWLHSLDSLLTSAFKVDSLVPGHGEIGTLREAVQFTNHYLIDTRDKAAAVVGWGGTPLANIRDWGDLGAYQGLEFYNEVHFLNLRRLYNEAKGIKTPGRANARAFKRT